jgi:single-strand DNA-binding protein
MSLNRVEIIGNLGRDPEIRTTNSGNKCANLRVAVSERWKDRDTGERKERTEWVPVTIWGPLAGVAEQYLRKGSKVYIAGKFTTRKWQDQSGQDRYSTEVVVQGPQAQMEMLDGPSGGKPKDQAPQDHGGYGESPSYGAGRNAMDDGDEIPF